MWAYLVWNGWSERKEKNKNGKKWAKGEERTPTEMEDVGIVVRYSCTARFGQSGLCFLFPVNVCSMNA
jgi:hypothetical protein